MIERERERDRKKDRKKGNYKEQANIDAQSLPYSKKIM